MPVPNIEALVAKGLVLDNAWASPACSMTRATIVTGQYGYRTGVTSVGAVLPASTPTVFDRITADSPADYGQAFFGKYHWGGGLFEPRAGGAFADAPKIPWRRPTCTRTSRTPQSWRRCKHRSRCSRPMLRRVTSPKIQRVIRGPPRRSGGPNTGARGPTRQALFVRPGL